MKDTWAGHFKANLLALLIKHHKKPLVSLRDEESRVARQAFRQRRIPPIGDEHWAVKRIVRGHDRQ
jgi:hypothetical protein